MTAIGLTLCNHSGFGMVHLQLNRCSVLNGGSFAVSPQTRLNQCNPLGASVIGFQHQTLDHLPIVLPRRAICSAVAWLLLVGAQVESSYEH
jgi:hypothetical protein